MQLLTTSFAGRVGSAQNPFSLLGSVTSLASGIFSPNFHFFTCVSRASLLL